MDHVLYVLLGWLLGLLSPGIAERIRRKHRQKEMIASLLGELRELQYTMAWVSYLLRAHLGTVTDRFLDWAEPIIRGYDGPDADPRGVEAVAKSREMPEEQRRQVHLAMRGANWGLGLKQYRIPFLEGLAGEISVCPLEFQRRVWRIKDRLDLFNQDVVFLQCQFEKTFDPSIVGDNRRALECNLNAGYEELARSAQLVADAISGAASAQKERSRPDQGGHRGGPRAAGR